MIEILTIKDEVVDGQRRAAGRKLHMREVIALDRYNVVFATSKGSAPPSGKQFFARFSQLLNSLNAEKYEMAEIVEGLKLFFNQALGICCDNMTVRQMEDNFGLCKRKAGGASFEIYDKLRKMNDNSEPDNDQDE